ncbi:LysR family transcriptional regulator [Nitrogeniibacter mangrovi]|uniref:LysR family transcriptional regulator n=1 Tax=Nitrogeniibacter mangrovi TaxID=2016596 RepID=A0A6C1AXV4_9RHOO|nr:LysR family transcriptional regulator [Nitrogeniibacter mangrovi]QID16191.1 LysR family transcriptional regulator [Nitrogeniibacter mangrovi]
MRPGDLNFRHLLYFWAVAREGSITRAAQTLGLSVQAISTQLSQLEAQLGHTLLVPRSRGLVPSETGRLVLGYADQIFQLGAELREVLDRAEPPERRLVVGLTDPIPKLVAFHLLEGVLRPEAGYRLTCIEGELDDLIADLVLNRLDVVLSHRPVVPTANLKVYARPLGNWAMALYGTDALCAHYQPQFPARLGEAPLLLPMPESPLRLALEEWFRRHRLAMKVRAECADSALLKTFGCAGVGLFAAPACLADDMARQYGVRQVGVLDGVSDSFYAISTERRIQHPALQAIVASAPDVAR